MWMDARTTIVIVLTWALLTAGVTAAPPLVPVRVAYREIQSWGPLFIAEREGFFTRQGLRIEWVPVSGAAEGVAPLLEGQMQVLPGSVSAAFFNAATGGAQVRLVADKGYIAPGSRTFSSLVVRKDLAGGAIRTLADLKGRRVAVNTVGSSSHYALAAALSRGGLRLEDIDLQRMPIPAMIAGLTSKALDAIMIPEPWISQVEERGLGVLFAASGDLIPNEEIAFLIYGPDLLVRDRGMGRRFMVAYLEGLRQYVRGPIPRNVATIAAATQVPADLILRGGWQAMFPDGHIEINRLRRFQDWLYEIGLIGVRQPILAVVDTSFIDYANSVLSNR